MHADGDAPNASAAARTAAGGPVRLLVGVCGSISAVAVPHLVLWMRQTLGVTHVKIILTRSADALVGTRIMRSVTDHGVYVSFDDVEQSTGPHVALANWADVILVLPATANVLGKVANGISDDLLTTTLLAASCPVVVVPVTSATMWSKPAVRRNVARLREDGYEVVEPKAGVSLAEGRPEAGSIGDYRPAVVSAIAKAIARRNPHDAAPAASMANHHDEGK